MMLIKQIGTDLFLKVENLKGFNTNSFGGNPGKYDRRCIGTPIEAQLE